jgi:Flp pilus assembly protein TadD
MAQKTLPGRVAKPIARTTRKEFDQAVRLFDKGQLAAARALLERILARHPDHTGTLNNLAAIAWRDGDLPRALDYSRRVVAQDTTNAVFMRNLGQILFDMTLYKEAAEGFRLASQLDRHDAKAHSGYGIALRLLERWDEAAAASIRAIELDPTLSVAYDNLAVTQMAQRDFDSALQLFHEAIRLAPDSATSWNNLGDLLLNRGGEAKQAEAAFRRAVALAPHEPLVRMNLGMALLQQGDFAAGWREYEHRWQASALRPARRPPALPRWDGSAAKRTLLLHAEQGLGDGLQFCRYAPLVAARGHRVILEVQAELVDLIAHSLASDTVTVVGRPDSYPGIAGLPAVDAHCPLMSLPMMFGTTFDTIPSAPYLRADAAKARDWSKRLDATQGCGLKIGLVWAGNPRRDAPLFTRELDARRSMTLAAMAPLLDVPGTSFVSLQKGEGAEQLRASGYDTIYDADPELGSFGDTAALVSHLDLVICVDTSVAHLVGAMGKPVWMLSRYDSCWRWLEDRSDSPWYPTMRIFRQGVDRSWEKVIEQVRFCLLDLAATAQQPGTSSGVGAIAELALPIGCGTEGMATSQGVPRSI